MGSRQNPGQPDQVEEDGVQGPVEGIRRKSRLLATNSKSEERKMEHHHLPQEAPQCTQNLIIEDDGS